MSVSAVRDVRDQFEAWLTRNMDSQSLKDHWLQRTSVGTYLIREVAWLWQAFAAGAGLDVA